MGYELSDFSEEPKAGWAATRGWIKVEVDRETWDWLAQNTRASTPRLPEADLVRQGAEDTLHRLARGLPGPWDLRHVAPEINVNGLTVSWWGDWLVIRDDGGSEVGRVIVGFGPHAPAAIDVVAAILGAVSQGMLDVRTEEEHDA